MDETQFEKETLALADAASHDMAVKFRHEVRRLLRSGAIDRDEGCNRAVLFGVAMENLADHWLRGRRSGLPYKAIRTI
jgi:hypothetical protein